MKLREIRTLNESTEQHEGVAGAVLGGIAGAALTKTPGGAMTGAKLGSEIQDTITGNDDEIDEGVMSEIDAFLTDVAENPDDGFEKIYNALTGDEGEPVRQYLQNMYDKISINKRLHPDDDFEEIVEVMLDYIEADFGQQESVEESKEVPQFAVRVGDREVTFEDKEEADRFISLAKLGGIKAEAVQVTKQPAQPKTVVSTDDGQSVSFANDQDAQQFAAKLKQGQVSVGVSETEEDDGNPVEHAITNRILNGHRDWFSKYGVESILAAVEYDAEFVGDVDEIGSSDVSGWVKQVEDVLKSAKNNEKIEVEEKAQSPYAIGMAQAMKSTGDEPPLKKSTIKKAHEIAKKVMAKEDESVAESIEQVFEDKSYTIHVDNAHDFDLDDDRGIDRALQTVFKDAGVDVVVDPHDEDSTKAIIMTNQDINDLLTILDQNGIQAHLVDIVKQESVTEGVLDDTDDSGFMAKSNIYQMIKNAVALHEMISDRDELEGWVEEKITLAADYIKTVKEYLEYNKIRGVEQPEQTADMAPEVTPESKPNTLVDNREFNDIMALSSRLTKR